MGDIYIGDNNGIARKVNSIYVGDANGIARKVQNIYVGDANGIARKVYSAFDPTLPTYSGWSYYPDYHGAHDILMTFVTRQKLLDAQAAGYTQIRFTLSILHYGGNADEVGIGVNTTSYFNGAYIRVYSSETDTKSQTFYLNISDMIATNASAFYLVHNATRSTSADQVYMALSSPSFL